MSREHTAQEPGVAGSVAKRAQTHGLSRSRTGGLIAPVLLVVIGMLAAWEASAWPVGELRRMGPGFFPVAVSVALLACCLGLLVQRREATRMPGPGWYRLTIVLGAVIGSLLAFAFLMPTLGLAPAAMTTILVASLPQGLPRTPVLILAVGVTVGGALIFMYALGIPVSLFVR
jgi:hypothetical protein